VIIRDDDICYFTPPSVLETLYGKILENNKVNFAVIPNVYASITRDKTDIIYKKEKLLYDPLIHPKFRGKNEYYNIEKNYDLIEFLNKKNVEVLQHGYTHEKIRNLSEFAIDDREMIYERAIKGKNILKKCIKKGIDFFIPPWDAISKEFIDMLYQEYKGIIASTILPIGKNFNLLYLFYINKIFRNNYFLHNKLLIIDNYDIINGSMDIKLIQNRFNKIIRYNEIIVIQNHYWEFFENWEKLNKLIKIWNVICNYILNDENIKIITYNELYSLLRSRKR